MVAKRLVLQALCYLHALGDRLSMTHSSHRESFGYISCCEAVVGTKVGGGSIP
jgi:hypothetical protein